MPRNMPTNRLTAIESHKLFTWLATAEFKPGETAADISVRATKILGFGLTANNIANGAEAIERKLPRNRKNDDLADAWQDIRTVATHLAILMSKMGDEVPETLTEIIAR